MTTTTKRPGGRPRKAVPDAPEIASQLRASRRAVARAEAKLAEAIGARDGAVRDAIAAGWSHSAVADAIGTSKGRIGQIVG